MDGRSAVEEDKDELLEIELNRIVLNPYQPRKYFAEEELIELANSIREVGIIHPPLVRASSDGFELISGERRLRAAALAGLTKIPVFVRKGSHKFSAQAALIENIQRVDLNPMEITHALKRLIEEFDYSQEELAHKVGKKRSTVANYLRLLSLPMVIQESVAGGRITMGHAKVILSAESVDDRLYLHEKVIKEGLAVRKLEQEANKLVSASKPKESPKPPRDFQLAHIEDKLRYRLGTGAVVQWQGGTGSITIEYYSLDDLDRLLELFGVYDDE